MFSVHYAQVQYALYMQYVKYVHDVRAVRDVDEVQNAHELHAVREVHSVHKVHDVHRAPCFMHNVPCPVRLARKRVGGMSAAHINPPRCEAATRVLDYYPNRLLVYFEES